MTVHVSVDAARPPVRRIVDDLGYTNDWHWSWASYKAAVAALSRTYGLRRHLEIGGGRDALFTPDEAAELGARITVNDISAHELSLAPAAFEKLCCDIASDEALRAAAPGSFDLLYSRMVMEHVADVPAMWRNSYELLAPGGVALAFFPTLHAPPFVVNRLVPERLSSAVLKRLFPDRADDGDNPKFPALYDHCYGDERTLPDLLKGIGFREAIVLPFYGYSYFWKIPGLKQVDAAFTRLAAARDWRTFTSFAYAIGVK